MTGGVRGWGGLWVGVGGLGRLGLLRGGGRRGGAVMTPSTITMGTKGGPDLPVDLS